MPVDWWAERLTLAQKEKPVKHKSKLLRTFAALGPGVLLLFGMINFEVAHRVQPSPSGPAEGIRVPGEHDATEVPKPTRQKVVETYGKLPLSFERVVTPWFGMAEMTTEKDLPVASISTGWRRMDSPRHGS